MQPSLLRSFCTPFWWQDWPSPERFFTKAMSAPDLADDIANGRSLTNRCVETSRTGHVVQLECQAMSLRVTTADMRAVRAGADR